MLEIKTNVLSNVKINILIILKYWDLRNKNNDLISILREDYCLN